MCHGPKSICGTAQGRTQLNNIDADFADIAALDRKALLVDAAQRLDALRGHLGGRSEITETPEGKLVRTLAEDEGRFAKSLALREIADKAFLTRNLPVPVSLTELFRRYRYYFLEFPFELDPAAGWGFNKLEVRIDLNPNDPPSGDLPRVFQIFPDPKFQTLFEANANLEVGVNAHGEFSAKPGGVDVQVGQAAFKVGADLGAEVGGKAGFVIGPFSYSIKRAVISHRGTGKEWARWEISGTQLNRGDDPRLMVIVQVPKQIRQLKIRGQLIATRYFSLANYSFIEAIKQLPNTLRRFIEGGTPYYHRPPDDWDVTEQMELGK
jgi:hypothetical protein